MRMLPNTKLILLCKLIFITFLIKNIAIAAQEWNLPLEYSIEDAAYTSFGSVKVKSMFNEISAQFIPTSNEKIELLKNALASTEGKKDYRIRSDSVFSTNSVEGFIQSEFAHLIELTVDMDKQQLLSITHFPAHQRMNISRLQKGGSDENQSPIAIFTRIKGVSDLPIPDTASYLHRLEEEKRARQHGATQDNRSFLQKYWMYFVPVVLFVILSNAFNPEQVAE